MTEQVVLQTTPPVVQVVIQSAPATVTAFVTSPPSVAEKQLLPDPTELTNGRMVAVNGGAWVDVPPPAGVGDMQSLIYDPQGVAANMFDAANLSGVIDCGVF